ncbi:MAG: hypothetical protein H6834_02050 [Planctomycetes bacterium]|nr:hypothetical protein [Planctomycetota bacterium]
MNLRKTLLATVAATACLAATGFPQNPDGPYWNEYPIPAGMTAYNVLGSVVALEAPNAIHLYSGQLRKWTVQAVGNAPTLSITNSYCIIQDGTKIHGYSSRTGKVETLDVSATAALHVGSLSSSWVAVVVDGTTMYGWSGFYGEWVKQQLTAPAASTDLGSHAAVITDGTNAYGWSAFYGTWVTQKIGAMTAKHVFRNGALIGQSGPDSVLAFSSYANNWSSLQWSGAATAQAELQDGYALLQNGARFLVFDALQGVLSRRVEAATPQVISGRNVCVLATSTRTSCYAAGLGTWTVTPAPIAAANIQVAGGSFGALAMLDTGTGLVAFSGLTGTMTPLNASGTFSVSLGDTAAFADGGPSLRYAYSAIRDVWVPMPSSAMANVISVNPMFNGFVIETAAGYDGFSARLAQWANNPAPGGNLVTQTSGALTLVTYNDRIEAFDSTICDWRSEPTAGLPNTTGRSIWRLCAIAVDRAQAHGYSLFHNTWEKVALQGTYQTHRANSSIGFALTSSHVYVFTANGSLSNNARFPEFSRFVVRGQPFRYMQTGPSGTLAVALIGTQHLETSLGAFGTLWMDPASMFTVPLGVIPANGILDASLVAPQSTSFNGTILYMQSLLVPQQGQPWLSNAMRPIFL